MWLNYLLFMVYVLPSRDQGDKYLYLFITNKLQSRNASLWMAQLGADRFP